MAVEPTASGVSICDAGGIVLMAAPLIFGCSLKPNFWAVSTSRLAPTFTPSGAKTELHDSAKLFANEPPHDSPFAFSRPTPSMVAFVSTGNDEVGLTMLLSSAAVAVMTLKVE